LLHQVEDSRLLLPPSVQVPEEEHRTHIMGDLEYLALNLQQSCLFTLRGQIPLVPCRQDLRLGETTFLLRQSRPPLHGKQIEEGLWQPFDGLERPEAHGVRAPRLGDRNEGRTQEEQVHPQGHGGAAPERGELEEEHREVLLRHRVLAFVHVLAPVANG